MASNKPLEQALYIVELEAKLSESTPEAKSTPYYLWFMGSQGIKYSHDIKKGHWQQAKIEYYKIK